MWEYLGLLGSNGTCLTVFGGRSPRLATASILIALGVIGVACATGEDVAGGSAGSQPNAGGAAAQSGSGGSGAAGAGGVQTGGAGGVGGAGGSGGVVADGSSGGSGGVAGVGGADSSAGGAGGSVDSGVGGAGGSGGVDSGSGGSGGTGGTGGVDAGTGGSGGSDACVAETDAVFCSRLGKACGSWTGTDNCGAARTVASCGTCTLPQKCGEITANACGCTPENNAAFCARLGGKNCGNVTNNDNCGAPRTASCGTCTAPATCGASNVCACPAETDPTFCSRLGKNCDSFSGTDNCGVARTAACGMCTLPQTCGAVTANVCGCVAESNTAFCARLGGKNCGNMTAADNCAVSRTVSCGSCTLPQACGCGGTANVCGNLPDGGACSFRLEVEAGTLNGPRLDANVGCYMSAAGQSVCWSNISMAGATQASVRYSSGEGAGDSLNVTFNGATIGNIALATCGAWDGDCATASGALTLPDAGSLTGTLCLVGVGNGAIAELNYLDISGG
jgi:hypothetical protein